MTNEIDWNKLTRDDFYVLGGEDNASEHNVYVPGYGYVVDHIDHFNPAARRDDPDHWDKQFQNTEASKGAWKPRPGPLELVYKLAQEKSEPYQVLNLGAGLGEFTCDLARIPKVHVAHVDFSQQACRVAEQNIGKLGLEEKTRVVNSPNLSYLEAVKKTGLEVDFIFIYGGLGENMPFEKDIKANLKAAAAVLKPGGRLWYVGLEQTFLSGEGDTHVTDILGEWPTKPGFISEVLLESGMVVVRQETGDRPDRHPLKASGAPEDHFHSAYRSLWVKPDEDENIPVTPEFGFKDAVDPKWQETWQQLTFV